MTTTDSHEETPQSSPSMIDLWKQQVAALSDPDQAAAAIGSIHDGLIGLYNDFIQNGQQDQANQAAQAYNMAVAIFESHQQRDVVIAGGAAAIQEADAQRQEAVDALEGLMQAIAEGDEEHPALAEYASDIRGDQEQVTLNDPYVFEGVMEGAYEDASMMLDEEQNESVTRRWGINYRQADQALGILTGNLIATPEQEALLRQFFALLPTGPIRDPLAETFRNAGAFSPDDAEADDDSDE
jgi:hypothetical protein